MLYSCCKHHAISFCTIVSFYFKKSFCSFSIACNLYSQVPNGTHFKYTYFLKNKKTLTGDLIWRSGPQFSLSVPLDNEERKEVLVRDSWMRTRLRRWPNPSWGSWMFVPVGDGHHINEVICGTSSAGNCKPHNIYLDIGMCCFVGSEHIKNFSSA